MFGCESLHLLLLVDTRTLCFFYDILSGKALERTWPLSFGISRPNYGIQKGMMAACCNVTASNHLGGQLQSSN